MGKDDDDKKKSKPAPDPWKAWVKLNTEDPLTTYAMLVPGGMIVMTTARGLRAAAVYVPTAPVGVTCAAWIEQAKA